MCVNPDNSTFRDVADFKVFFPCFGSCRLVEVLEACYVFTDSKIEGVFADTPEFHHIAARARHCLGHGIRISMADEMRKHLCSVIGCRLRNPMWSAVIRSPPLRCTS